MDYEKDKMLKYFKQTLIDVHRKCILLELCMLIFMVGDDRRRFVIFHMLDYTYWKYVLSTNL
jgi:hypothetical protein